MINMQVRLPAASIALVAGALAAGSDSLNLNVGIVMILVTGAISLAE